MRNIIFIIILFIIIIIIYNSFFTTKEFFYGPDKSSTPQIGSGASEYYGWGFHGIKDRHRIHKRHPKKYNRKCPKCDHVYIDNDVCNIIIDDRHKCRHCDITKNKDIDKYVLKSSVPPCQDLSKFATKAMVHPCPDMNKYVLKSKLPEYCRAYYPDRNRYMLKTQCRPVIHKKYKIVYNDIQKHQDFHRYISKEHCKQYKKSWIQNFEEWWDDIFNKGKKYQKKSKTNYPYGYAYSPYAGYGTNNPGYALDGGYIRHGLVGPEPSQ